MTLQEKIQEANKARNAAREAKSAKATHQELQMGEFVIRPTDAIEKEENKVVAGYEKELPDKGKEWLDERERNKRFAESVKGKIKRKGVRYE